MFEVWVQGVRTYGMRPYITVIYNIFFNFFFRYYAKIKGKKILTFLVVSDFFRRSDVNPSLIKKTNIGNCFDIKIKVVFNCKIGRKWGINFVYNLLLIKKIFFHRIGYGYR